MRQSNPGRFRQQAGFLRRQFLQDGDLPFTNVLSEDLVERALTALGGFWLDRIFSRWSRCGSSWGRCSVRTIPAALRLPA
jgi:hypothetical protein